MAQRADSRIDDSEDLLGCCCEYRIFFSLQILISDTEMGQKQTHSSSIEGTYVNDLYEIENSFYLSIADK